MGSLTGAVALPNSNGGVRRFPQPDWKPGVECKTHKELDCETDRSSRVRKQVLVIRWFLMEGPSLIG